MRLRLLALVALALAAVPISSRLHLEIVGRTAVGEVTALEARTDADGDKTYAPVIELTTATGRRVRLPQRARLIAMKRRSPAMPATLS